jgi:hypothetical protein
MSTGTDGANAHSSEVTMKPATPTTSGIFLPRTSLTGPATTWPTEMPMRQAVRVSWTWEGVLSISPLIAGSAGRYMSMARGPIADRAPRISSRPRRSCLTTGCVACATDMPYPSPSQV